MRGLYTDGDLAKTTDENNAIMIPRDLYEDKGYLPPFDELPTREKYEADIA